MVLFLGLFLRGSVQEVPDYSQKNHEISIGYFNAFNLTSPLEFEIGYRKNLTKGALRTGLGMDFNKWHNESDTDIRNNSGLSLSPQVGYEIHQDLGRTRLYYCSDIFVMFSSNISDYEGNNSFTPRSRKTHDTQFGIRPLVGLTVFLSPMISLSTETYLEISYFTRNEQEVSQTGETSSSSTRMIEAGMGPLGIVSVNIHF